MKTASPPVVGTKRRVDAGEVGASAPGDSSAIPACLRRGGGTCGATLRSIDWRAHPLGPMAGWPATLTWALAMVLHARQPMHLFWGPLHLSFYNDGYLPILGPEKHPATMGRPGIEVWPTNWSQVKAHLDEVQRGESPWRQDHQVFLWRNARLEESFHTYSYSPVFCDDGHIAATLVVATETTRSVLVQRRLTAMQALTRALVGCKTQQVVFDNARAVLERYGDDIRGAIFCGLDVEGETQTDVELEGKGAAGAQADASHASRFAEPRGNGHVQVLHGGSRQRVVMRGVSLAENLGWIDFTTSPNLSFDAEYAEFLQQIADHVGTALEVIESKTQADIFFNLPCRLMCLASLKGYLTRVSPAMVEILGYSESELLSTPYIDFVHADDRAKTQEQAQLLKSQQQAVNFVNRYRCRNGRYRWFSWTTQPRHGVLYCMTYDLTDLIETQDKLVEAVAARDIFLGIASHELKTPLTSLKLYSQLMLRQFDKHGMAYFTPQKLVKLLNVSLMQADRLGRLVEDMLDISRIAAGKLAIQCTQVDLSALVRETNSRFDLQCKAADCPVRCEITPGIVGHVDAFRVEQVLNNLLTNALRFASGKPIALSLHRDGDVAVLQVADGGPGILAEHQARIFERFERSAAPNEVSGMGLGLYISKQIVEEHGGRIALHSTPGQGAHFSVHLPLRTTQ